LHAASTRTDCPIIPEKASARARSSEYRSVLKKKKTNKTKNDEKKKKRKREKNRKRSRYKIFL